MFARGRRARFLLGHLDYLAIGPYVVENPRLEPVVGTPPRRLGVKVAVFGLGYVGSVTAAALARDGHEVVGVDPAAPKVESIRAGRAPVLEPGLDELIGRGACSAGRLRATDDPAEALAGAELSLSVCRHADSRRTARSTCATCARSPSRSARSSQLAAAGHVVVVRSTVLPGSTREHVIPVIEQASGRSVGEGWDVAVNPEFLREGTSLEDYDRPSRILVGERDAGAGAARAASLRARRRPTASSCRSRWPRPSSTPTTPSTRSRSPSRTRRRAVWAARGADAVPRDGDLRAPTASSTPRPPTCRPGLRLRRELPAQGPARAHLRRARGERAHPRARRRAALQRARGAARASRR